MLNETVYKKQEQICWDSKHIILKASQDELNPDSSHVQEKRSHKKWNQENSPGQEIIMDHAIKEQILTSTRLAWWTKLNLTEVIPFSNTKSIENMSTCLKQEIGFVIVWKGLFWITKCFLKFSLVLILWFQLYSPSICLVRHFELYKQVLGGKSAHWFIILITFFFLLNTGFACQFRCWLNPQKLMFSEKKKITKGCIYALVTS